MEESSQILPTSRDIIAAILSEPDSLSSSGGDYRAFMVARICEWDHLRLPGGGVYRPVGKDFGKLLEGQET